MVNRKTEKFAHLLVKNNVLTIGDLKYEKTQICNKKGRAGKSTICMCLPGVSLK
jgi:hypothetical protein